MPQPHCATVLTLQLWVVSSVQTLLLNAVCIGWLPNLSCENYLPFFFFSGRTTDCLYQSKADFMLQPYVRSDFIHFILLFLQFFMFCIWETFFWTSRWWMKDNHVFLSTSVYIHVVLSFKQEFGLRLFALTGHLSPLENTIDVLLYQSVFHHVWTVELRNPINLHNHPHCMYLWDRSSVLFCYMCC